MRFKQFKTKQKLDEEDLFEINMSYSNLQKLVKDIDARAGLEFEMIVPDVKGSDDDRSMEPDYNYDEGTYSINQIVDFFNDGDHNSSREVRRLELDLRNDFNEWLDEQFSARWEADAEEFVYEYLVNDVSPVDIADILGIDFDTDKDDGLSREQVSNAAELVVEDQLLPYYEQARDRAFEEFNEENADEGEWLGDVGLDNMSDVENRYNITWPYWDYPENEAESDIDSVAQSFSQAVGRAVNTSTSYHSGRREPDKYVIEPDGSLMPGSDEDEGLEFVSPPLTIPEMLQDLKEVMAWAKSTGCYTNRSTGLHMNISVPGYDEKKLDFVKLALLIGDKYVLEQFGRSANTYCKSAIEKIQERLKNINPSDINSVLETLKTGLNTLASRLIQGPGVGKYTSIHPQDNRVEFRSPGGDWLDEPIEKLSSTLLRFVVGLDAAVDPNKYKEEYYKKFYKLVSPAFAENNQLHQVLSLYMSGDKEQAKTQAQKLKLQKQAKRELVPGQKYEWEVMKIADKGRTNYYSVNVIAKTEKEAIANAIAAGGLPFQNADPEELMATPTAKVQDTTNPSAGDWYAIQRLRAIGGNETVHSFQAQDRTTAERIADEYIAGRRWDPADYVVVRQQPPSNTSSGIRASIGEPQPLSGNSSTRTGVPQGQEVIERLLGMADQAADANYEIVRRDNYQPVFLFIANTAQDASRVLERYLDLIGAAPDSEDFGFRERARPGSTLDLQRQRAERSAQAAVQSTRQSQGNNRLWQLVDNNTGEVAYDFYLSHENTRQDAKEVGLRWVRNNGNPNTTYSVREQPQETGTVRPQDQQGNTQWRILINGQEIHRFWNRPNQGEANAAASAWVGDQIRRGLLNRDQISEIEIVPVMDDRT